MVTGIDLIKAQISIAAGLPLPMRQEEVLLRGVSMECRINAENVQRNFQPCAGKITRMNVPGGMGVRFDSHAYVGYTVPPNYDSMIGKLIVHQPTRAEAIACMLRALDELRIEGIETTVPFHRQILRDSTFVDGWVDTTYAERMNLA
jgi:acetyl-CoA carboxylase biotin carboxylase subunit